MCGIVGYVGHRPAQEVLLAGLEKLEYRGYDSAGISVLDEGRLESVRAVGNLAALREAVARRSLEPSSDRVAVGATLEEAPSGLGIGHTRWATHGGVTEANAHPHFDTDNRVHVVVNGIVENYLELKEELAAAGATFTSETDVEVIAHLISRRLDEHGLIEAVRLAYERLRGHYAFVAATPEEPEVLVAARKECPLVIGRGDGEQFVASGIPAFLAHTREVQIPEDDDIVVIRSGGVEFLGPDGSLVERDLEHIDWDAEAAEKGGFDTFMLKEIHEQPDAVAETIADRTAHADEVDLGDIGIGRERLRGLRRVVVVACGTSYHAGLVGRYAIEEWARVPVELDIASEYRYRNPVVGENDLVVGISQSGETADTLAAMRLARERGAHVLAVTNVMGSQATRDSDGVVFTRAGLEIGVAATKTFVSQVAVMYLLGLHLAAERGTLPQQRIEALIAELKALPHLIQETIERVDEPVARIAERWQGAGFFLYLGRHIGLPIALEGALKLKEISYIPTDAYAAGEMKHGPIALLDERTPVVCIATESPVLEKILSNASEAAARGANLIAVATEGAEEVEGLTSDIVRVPRTDWLLQPILAIVPLQLLAYRIALARGLNVDQPRNLAKTVTVE